MSPGAFPDRSRFRANSRNYPGPAGGRSPTPGKACFAGPSKHASSTFHRTVYAHHYARASHLARTTFRHWPVWSVVRCKSFGAEGSPEFARGPIIGARPRITHVERQESW